MTDIIENLTLVRHRCGCAYDFVRDNIVGVSRTILFEVPCDSIPGLRVSCPVAFRLGGPADLHAFTKETHDYENAHKQFGLERLERGDSLIVGELDGEVVFYAWLMYGQMDLDQNVCIPTVPDAAYVYRAFTVSRARGLGICGASYGYSKGLLLTGGYRRLICRIAPRNAASIQAHARVGFERCGVLWKMVAPGHVIYYADESTRARLPGIVMADYFTPRGFLKKCDA